MCGRFTLRTPLNVLAQQFLFELGEAPAATQVSPRYNIAPTQTIAAVRQSAAAPGGRESIAASTFPRESGQTQSASDPFIVTSPSPSTSPNSAKRELALFRWGLIPSWANDAKIASSLINARSETLADKPSFRTAFARSRCLILADGFYEWKKDGKQKLPYYFQLTGEKPFAFAGLWERWRPPQTGDGKMEDDESSPIESCTIITTTANELCAPFHDRMPVILDPAHYDLWLDPTLTDTSRLLPILLPLPATQMKTRPVKPRVNNVKNDDPAVLITEQELF